MQYWIVLFTVALDFTSTLKCRFLFYSKYTTALVYLWSNGNILCIVRGFLLNFQHCQMNFSSVVLSTTIYLQIAMLIFVVFVNCLLNKYSFFIMKKIDYFFTITLLYFALKNRNIFSFPFSAKRNECCDTMNITIFLLYS